MGGTRDTRKDGKRRSPAREGNRSNDAPLSRLLEHTLIGVYKTTVGGAILDCSDSFARMLGYRNRERLIKHRAHDLYFARSDRAEFIRQLKSKGVLTNLELRMRRRDGRPVDVLENVTLGQDDHGRRTIIHGVAVDISDRRQVEDSLRVGEVRSRALAQDLRRLAQHLQTVREEERSLIAQELHDQLGQQLTGLNLDLHWLRGRSWNDAEETLKRIDSMSLLLGRTIGDIRRICANLRLTALGDLGIVPAVEWTVRDFEKRTSIKCRLTRPRRRLRLPEGQSVSILRILQESLTNIARHANAKNADIHFSVGKREIRLRVRDDGRGLSPEAPSALGSLGLIGMRERALRWDGVVGIQNSKAGGTVVELRMPITSSSATEQNP